MPLYPQKNLIPPLSSGWFVNGTAQEIVFAKVYRLEMYPTGTYKYTSITVPVQYGKTYVFNGDITGSTSVDTIRIFKGTNLGAGAVIVAKINSNRFTVDETYGGLVTVVLSNGSQVIPTTIDNFQLEEGTISTPFEPYELGMKPAELESDNLVPPLIHPDWVLNQYTTVTGPYSVVMDTPSGQWISIDIPIEVGETYIFTHDSNVAMYTDVRSAAQYHPKVQDGVPPGVPLKITHPDAKFIRVAYGTPGKGTFYAKDMCLRKGSQIKPFKPYEEVMKESTLVPSVNLINPDVSKWRQGSADSSGNITGGSTRLVLVERIKMSPSTKYTVKLDNGYRMFMRNFSDQTAEISNSGWVTDGYTFTTALNIKTTLILIARGDDTALNTDEVAKALPMLAQGDWDRNIPYEEVMRPYIGLPEKNLIPDFNDSRWFDDPTVASPTVTVYSDNPYGMRMIITGGAQGRLIWIPVELGKTYTFSFGKITGLYRMYKRKVNNHDTNMVLVQDGSVGKPDTFSFTVDGTYGGYVTLRLTHGSAATLYYENLQLEEGTQTQFEKMSLTKLKPAILYPKKNLIQPYAQWKTASPNIKETDNNYYFVLNAPTLYYGQPFTLPVKALTKYSLSAEGSGRLSMIYYDAANNQLGRKTVTGTSVTGTSVTDTTPVGTAKMQCYFEIVSLNTDAVFKNVQLEEGDPTPFEPYELTTMKPN